MKHSAFYNRNTEGTETSLYVLCASVVKFQTKPRKQQVCTTAKIPTEQMQRYILTARRREQQRLAALQQRRSRGLEVAQQAAHLLKQEFAATRVVLFGSLLGEPFHETSDIDLAVWGLPAKSYFQAVGQLLSLSEFEFDLVEAEFASPEILAAIAHGVEL